MTKSNGKSTDDMSSKKSEGAMKNEGVKKNGKKKKHRSKSKKPSVPNAAKLPTKSDDYSANWKQLLKSLESEKKSKPQSNKNIVKKPKAKVVQKPDKVEEEKKSVKPDIWFDDVDPDLLDPEDRPDSTTIAPSSGNHGPAKALVKATSFQGLTKAVGMDCEMVGVGYLGEESVLARVSIVNQFGHCVYDKYVKPREQVTDYRTRVSGIRPQDLVNALDFKVVQKEVSDLLEGRILVGHAIKHDLKVLFLTHPKKMIRDTSQYKPFRNMFNGKTPGLKKLSARLLGVTVQEGEHSSVQDAQATMRLYTTVKRDWERDVVKGSKAKGAREKAAVGQGTNVVASDKIASEKQSTSSGKKIPFKPSNKSSKQSTTHGMGIKPEYVDSD